MSKSEALEARLIDFAVRIVNVTGSLPRTMAGKHVASQLLRSGTSPAPNYAEACNAESGRDFLHKLRICLKELNESRIWLEIVIRSKMLPESKLSDLRDECTELCRIIGASVRTAKQRNNQ